MAVCSSGPAVGSKAAIHIGQEVCWGQLVRPTHLIDFTGESIQATENTIQSQGIRRDRAVHKLIRGTLDVGGDINGELSAQGFGKLIYNALGGYIKLEPNSIPGGGADGGKHARVNRVVPTTVAELLADTTGAPTEDLNRNHFLELAPETAVDFDNTTPLSDTVCFVYKVGLNKTLTFENNLDSGVSYYSFGGREVCTIAGLPTPAADPIHGVAGCTILRLGQVLDENGNAIDPDVNLNGGVLYAGQGRVRLPYLAAVKTGGSGTDVYLQPSTLTASGYTPAVNHAVIVAPTLVFPQFSLPALPSELSKGSWVFQWYQSGAVDYSNVWTHYIEAAADIPEGLTIEVDRDAAIFVYVGMRVNTMTVDFPSQEIATVTFSFLGKEEYAMGVLAADVAPGATSIVVNKVPHFPDPTLFPTGSQTALITIGEERGITYQTRVENPDGTVTLGGIPALGDGAILRQHLRGDNVDLKSSKTLEDIDTTPVIKGTKSPLTAFETKLFLDGYFEEVLNANITFNNNLNGDKFGLGSRFRFGLVAEQRTVEANLNVEFDDGKLYKKFSEGDFFSLEFRCISEAGDSEIDTTEIFHQGYFFLPKCKFNGSTPNASDQSFIVHDMPATCVYDDDYDNPELVVILVNSLEEDVLA